MIQRQPTAALETENAQENDATPPVEVTRVFVSGLPPKFTSEQLAAHFGSGFKVTDAHVLADRRIGFVGFQDSISAQKAMQHFNKSYVRMSRISVDLAKPVELSRTSGASVPISKRGQRASEPDSNRKRKRSQEDDGEQLRTVAPERASEKEDANGLAEAEAADQTPGLSSTDNDWLRGRTSRVLDLVDPDDIRVQQDDAPDKALSKESEPASGLSLPRDQETSPAETTAPAPREVSNARLFLRNLAFSITQDDLEQRFKQYGKIQEVSNSA